MLFYTAILVVCLIAAVILPLLYRLISSVVGAFLKTGHQRSKNLPASHLSNQTAAAVMKDPWVPQVVRLAASPTEARQETVGDKSYYGRRNVYAQPLQANVRLKSAGWLNREDCRTEDYSSYKIKRRTQGELNMISKPTN
jgi:hypothetical protein